MASILLERANDALNVNPPVGDSVLTTNGSNWMWAAFAVYALFFLAFLGLSFAARNGERVFHYIFAIALFVGLITYFANASDLGFSTIPQVNSLDRGLTRQIFFTKYINWVVAFPAIIIALGLISGVSWATIVYNIFLSWIWIISYLVAAYTRSNYKWGFFVFGTLAYFMLAGSTLGLGTRASRRLGHATRDHSMLSGYVNFLWLLYPIAWGLSDGGNRIGVTPHFIFFGILDILLVPVLAIAFIVLGRRWDYNRMNIAFTQYGRVNTAPGTFPEKDGHHVAGGAAGAPAVGHGAAGTTGPAGTGAPVSTAPGVAGETV